MSQPKSSIMMTCQVGAEQALKQEVARNYPDFRFAYSRKGFVTWHLPQSLDQAMLLFPLSLVFARTASISLGKISSTADDFASVEVIGRRMLLESANLLPDFCHYWCREGAENSIDKQESLPEALWLPYLAPAKDGDFCLDLFFDPPASWWIGFHRVYDEHSRYPGGMIPLQYPIDAVSRAWLKFEEAIRRFRIPIEIGSRWADIGAAPGGGTQALLARGAKVIAIDPAQLDASVLNHPNLTPIRGRINQIKRKTFQNVDWLMTDMNVAPNYTLDALEELTTRDDLRLQGLLFTLKLIQWKLADNIPVYRERIKRWGFSSIQIQQLTFNRQEIMVAAMR